MGTYYKRILHREYEKAILKVEDTKYDKRELRCCVKSLRVRWENA
jgi:hypothetical protein